MSTRRSIRLSQKRPKKHPKTPKKRSKIESQDPDSENEIGITSEPSEDSEEFMPEKKVRTRKTEWHCRFEDCIRSIRPFNKRKNRNDHEEWFFEFIFGSNSSGLSVTLRPVDYRCSINITTRGSNWSR